MGPLARLLDASEPHDVHIDSSQPHEHHLDTTWLLSGAPRSHARTFTAQEQTSFLFGFGKTKSPEGSGHEDPDVQKITEVNKHAMDKFKIITDYNAGVRKSREALDKVIGARYAAMRPLCQEYMRHRAELSGLAGAQCNAAQGRVNAEDLDETNAPFGCLQPDQSGSEELGTPLTLHQTRCGTGLRKLACSERLAELSRGDPAAGEEMMQAQKHAEPEPGAAEHVHKHASPEEEGANPPATGTEGPDSDNGNAGLPEPVEEQPKLPSMDEEFRQWCHPAFRLNAQPISENLSRAVLAPTAEDEAPVTAA